MLKKIIKELQVFSDLLLRFKNEKRLTEKIAVYHKKLRKNILRFEKKFLSLSNEFNEKMSENSEH